MSPTAFAKLFKILSGPAETSLSMTFACDLFANSLLYFSANMDCARGNQAAYPAELIIPKTIAAMSPAMVASPKSASQNKAPADTMSPIVISG